MFGETVSHDCLYSHLFYTISNQYFNSYNETFMHFPAKPAKKAPGTPFAPGAAPFH
jgi:hypothetical protein